MEVLNVPMAQRRKWKKLRAAAWSPKMMEQGRIVGYFGQHRSAERIISPIDLGGIGAGAIPCRDCMGTGTFDYPWGPGACNTCKSSGRVFISIP